MGSTYMRKIVSSCEFSRYGLFSCREKRCKHKHNFIYFLLVVNVWYLRLSCNLIVDNSGRYFTIPWTKRFFFTICNLKLVNFHDYFACHCTEKMDSDENYCDVNAFYHPNASENCEKQRMWKNVTKK